jgi:hypothetical protein
LCLLSHRGMVGSIEEVAVGANASNANLCCVCMCLSLLLHRDVVGSIEEVAVGANASNANT